MKHDTWIGMAVVVAVAVAGAAAAQPAPPVVSPEPLKARVAALRASQWPCPALDQNGQEARNLLVATTKPMDEDFSEAELDRGELLAGRAPRILASNQAAFACHRRQAALLEWPAEYDALNRKVLRDCATAARGNFTPAKLDACWQAAAPAVAPYRTQFIALIDQRASIVQPHILLEDDLKAGGTRLRNLEDFNVGY